MGLRVRESLGERFRADLHPRGRGGQWRRTFVVRTPKGKIAGVVQQHSETGEYRGVAYTGPVGPLHGTFAEPSAAHSAVMAHHYTFHFDAERFDRRTGRPDPDLPTAHDVSYTPGMGAAAQPTDGGSMEPSLPPQDTPQQAAVLRQSPIAQRVRALYPVGTRVRGYGGSPAKPGNLAGTVVRHVPATNSQGGSLTVLWDNGRRGSSSPSAIIRDVSGEHERRLAADSLGNRPGAKGAWKLIRTSDGTEYHRGEYRIVSHYDDTSGVTGPKTYWHVHKGHQSISLETSLSSAKRTADRDAELSAHQDDTVASPDRNAAIASADAAHAAAQVGAFPEPTAPTVPGSLAGADLTQVHPKAIDSELARLWGEQTKYQGYLDSIRAREQKATDSGRVLTDRESADNAAAKLRTQRELAKLDAEAAPLEEEFDRRGGWARYFIVQNGNGHVHDKMNCMTCYPTTRFGWLTDLAGKSEKDMVAGYGESACSVCFPSAPSMYEAMKAQGRTSDFARKTQAEKDARAKLRAEAQAAKDVKAISNPDGSPLRGEYGQVKTLVTARNELVGVMIQIGGAERAQAAGNTNGHVMRLDKYRDFRERLIAAIAHKTGASVDEVRAEFQEKAEKKAAKQRGWW